MRFLGVPLISSQLCINDCIPLIDKITAYMHSWSNTFLSFAGRALLIKSVICVLESFWCNHFLLPSAVHANIQSLLTRFLWKGNINHKGGAKVAWTTVCLPKKEGDLGIKNTVEWNCAQILSHMLQVLTKSNSLWALWVNGTFLRGKHFWTIKIPTECSWIWRKILRLRVVALQFISYSTADGNSISLWFKPW